MRRFIAMLLTCILLLSFSGCAEQGEESDALSFYYRAGEFSYDAQSSLLQAEYRDSSSFSSLEDALAAYLAGPQSENLRDPFPSGLSLISLRAEGDTLYLTLSDVLGSLTGLELTIALCCIAKTAMGLTDAENICISAQTVLLDGERTITLNEKNMNLLDMLRQTENA